MTEAPLESGQEVQETTEQPTPTPSVPSGDKQTSAPEVNAEALVEQLVPLLTEQLRPEWEKADQSVKDKRIAGLTDDVERLKVYLSASGGDVDKAVREMKVDDMLSGESQPVVGATGNEVQGAMEAISAMKLSAAGIDFEDPGYLALVGQYGWIQTPEHWGAVLDAYIGTGKTKEAKQEGVTAAAVVGNIGATVVSEDADEIAAELDRLQAPGPNENGVTHPDNIARRKELNAKLKALTPQRPDIK
jgi:hypothetical protein